MSRLDNYRSAMLAAIPAVEDAELARILNAGGGSFVSFVIDHGLGPLWHERTGWDEFRESRLAAEALFLAQEQALEDIDAALEDSGIEYAVLKGAANRQLLYENPALRSCYDLDLLVRPEERVQAAAVLVAAGYSAHAEARSISRELVLTRGAVDVDLHWGVLREGRLRVDPTSEMLDRRRQVLDTWMLSAEDALFVLLVHPAFAKHLAGWDMGLHRIADIVFWLRTQSLDQQTLYAMLEKSGVRTGAWATLRWVEMLTQPYDLPGVDEMLTDLCPGRLRRAWLDRWLRNDMSARTAHRHWVRLFGFTAFLHDTPGDALRAFAGRRRAHRRSAADLEAFQDLSA